MQRKNEIRFRIVGKPPLKASSAKAIKRFRKDVILAYEAAAAEIGFKPFKKDAPVGLEITFYSEALNGEESHSYKATSPDCDNLCKVLMDCLDKRGAGVFHDDGQVARLVVEKRFRRNYSETKICVYSL